MVLRWGAPSALGVLMDGNPLTVAEIRRFYAAESKIERIGSFSRFLKELRSLPFVTKDGSFREIQLLDLFTTLSQD